MRLYQGSSMYRFVYGVVSIAALGVALTGCTTGTSAVPGPSTAPPGAAVSDIPGTVTPSSGAASPLAGVATPSTASLLDVPSLYPYRKSAAHAPACARAGRVIDLPRGFPKSFPFPPGTAITSRIGYRSDLTRPIVGGVVPSSTFASTVSFFLTQLPRAGYRVRDGDAEAAEAESVYVGHGYIGRWRVRALDTCPTATVLFVFAERYPTPAR